MAGGVVAPALRTGRAGAAPQGGAAAFINNVDLACFNYLHDLVTLLLTPQPTLAALC